VAELRIGQQLLLGGVRDERGLAQHGRHARGAAQDPVVVAATRAGPVLRAVIGVGRPGNVVGRERGRDLLPHETREPLRIRTGDLVVALVAGDVGRAVGFSVVVDRYEDLRMQRDRDLGARLDRRVVVGGTRHHDLRAFCLEELLHVLRDVEVHVLLDEPGRTDRSGFVATVAGIDHDVGAEHGIAHWRALVAARRVNNAVADHRQYYAGG